MAVIDTELKEKLGLPRAIPYPLEQLLAVTQWYVSISNYNEI